MKCEQCDYTNDTLQGLRMHFARMHGVMRNEVTNNRTKKEKVHKIRDYKAAAAKAAKTRRENNRKAKGEVVPAPKIGRPRTKPMTGGSYQKAKTNGGLTFMEMTSFKVLSDDMGAIWLAEKIREG